MSALIAELPLIDLGDQRLNRRARRLLEKLGEKPTVSIPAACGGWGETRAAYRLFDHPEVSAERVLAPHIACTEERLRAHPRLLCIQDTTELDYPTKKGIAGLGPLNYESRWGMYLHPTLALTPERVPLSKSPESTDSARAAHSLDNPATLPVESGLPVRFWPPR
jgi:hypothetical protein